MALVERLMHDSSLPNSEWIHVHDFFAACHEIVHGAITAAQVKSFLNMSAADAAEFDALVAMAPTGNAAAAVAGKAMFISRLHAVFVLAEGRYPGYNTATAVRGKLGI